MRKLRLMIRAWLERIVAKLHTSDNEAEYQNRINVVREALFSTFPTILSVMRDKAIIENGIYNYFFLPDESFPKYTFVVPELAIYVMVLDVRSSNWEEARLRGVTRLEWEQMQETIATIVKGTADLATIGQAMQPKLLLIRWNDSIGHLTLLERLEKLLV